MSPQFCGGRADGESVNVEGMTIRHEPLPPGGRTTKTPRRKMFYVIVAWNVLMLIWLVSAVSNSSDVCSEETTYRDACQTGADAGTGLAVGFILFVAAAGDVVLVVLYHITQPEGPSGGPKRACPYCAEAIQPAATVCKHCGRDVPKPSGFTGAVCPIGHDNVLGARKCSTCGSRAVVPF